ncbi:MAG: ATP-binding protein [Deltaproteobacteria bacterium]|nr:ATP-binding protein [Deltaproteobacteria bacterium]
MTEASVRQDSRPIAATLVNTAVCDAAATNLMRVESGFTRGFAGMQLLGNTSDVCRSGKERARVALEGLGLWIPPQRVVINLTPADLKTDGSHFDLPIAVSLALLIGEAPPAIKPDEWLFAAELGLAGELRPVKGAVSFAVAAMAKGLRGIVVASDNAQEISVMTRLAPSASLQVLGFRDLRAVLSWMFGRGSTTTFTTNYPSLDAGQLPNFDDMILSPAMELAAITACAGMHSLLLRGVPGTGKSMLASRLASILPDLEPSERIETLRVHSMVSERLQPALLAGRPPYRAPHHQASAAALIGSADQPGELALAHGGVLFLDELPEFRRDLLEALREPLELGAVCVARSKHRVVWQTAVVLAAACNNCPCGWYGSSRRECHCSQTKIAAYRQRLSGPLLDRIDLHINVPETQANSADLLLGLSHRLPGSVTARMRTAVSRARQRAYERNRAFGCCVNRDLPATTLLEASGLAATDFAGVVNDVIPSSASNRSVMRCLRVARTLADIHDRETLSESDLVQAWRWQAEAAAHERGEMVHSLQ